MDRLQITFSRLLTLGCAIMLAGCARLTPPPPDIANVQASADLGKYDGTWFAAARRGRVDILQALGDAHFPLDTTTPEGYTALILAAYHDQPDALDYLLHAGADPCVGDRNGNTALMGALFKGEHEIAKRLVDTACPIDQTNNAGETALSFAALFGRLDLIPILVQRGADPDHVDRRGRTALQNALLQGNDSAVAALERAGAKSNGEQRVRVNP
jgi:uncharacterized protein